VLPTLLLEQATVQRTGAWRRPDRDHFNEGPHLLVEYVNGQPFSKRMKWIESETEGLYQQQRVLWGPKDEKRI